LTICMVVVTKDREDEVKRLLVSVAAQVKVPDKIVFVDSSDSSHLKEAAVEILKDKCPLIELVQRKCTLPEGRNIGIDRSKCDLVSFIDDDAVLDSGYFASIESFLESDPSRAIAGVEGEITNMYKTSIGMHSFWWAFNALFYLSYPGKGTYRRSGLPRPLLRSSAPVQVQVLSGSNMTIRREVLEKMRFDEELRGGGWREDLEFSRRVSMKHRLFHLPGARMQHVVSEKSRLSQSRFPAANLVNHRKLFAKNFDQDTRSRLAFKISELGMLLHLIFDRQVNAIKPFIQELLRGDGRTKILFVHPKISSFIQADLDILKKHFDVRVLDTGSKKKSLGGMLGAMWDLFLGVLWSDLTFSWFADIHAKWQVRCSRVFGKPSIVVVGGYEVAKLPEIGYGSLLDPSKTKMVKYILTRADKVLPVDESLKVRAMDNLGVDGKNMAVVPTGFDVRRFSPSGVKEELVLTVAVYNDWQRAQVKGLDMFVKTAALLPRVKFLVVGGSGEGADRLKGTAGSNVDFIGPVSQEELVKSYQRAKVYCQLSKQEGLPNAVCESMLCECIPVGSRIPGIERAVGDAGFLVPVGDHQAAADAIRKALVSNKGKDARDRIKELFSLENREKAIQDIVRELLE
jgi:glycosyltransferase involved in cell wall biosynthesis